jgi:hypothetical protein
MDWKLTKEFYGLISLTKALALDCEMVGVGYEGKRNALARVSLVFSTTQNQCLSKSVSSM